MQHIFSGCTLIWAPHSRKILPKIKNNPLLNFPSANDVYEKQVNLIPFKKSLLTKRNYLTETLFCKHVFRVFYQNELLDHDFEGWRHFKNRNQTKCSSLNLIHNTISFQHKYNLYKNFVFLVIQWYLKIVKSNSTTETVWYILKNLF